MNSIKSFCKSVFPFVELFIPFWAIALLLNFVYGKMGTHLWLNGWHNSLSDSFFFYLTYLGDWIPFAIALVLLLFNVRRGLTILTSQTLALFLITVPKKLFAAPRPLVWFEQHGALDMLYQIEGLHLHTKNSFPSGHTFAAFAFFISLSLFTDRKRLKILYFLLAVGVGYSRIFLSQHFLEDVLAGSFLAMISVFISYKYVYSSSASWLDKRIFTSKSKAHE